MATPAGCPGRQAPRERSDPAPIGSQRALADLRAAVDRAAAERGAYVRLATVLPALGAPEGAVVAAFERIDLMGSDAVAEIVADAVEPDRALADHAFAHRLARRAGTSILVGPGPLVVAPDLSAGLPSDPATRGGRALALQLIAVALARGDGLPTEQIIIDPLPPWLTDEPEPAARAIAEVVVRRALFPGHAFGFMQSPAGPTGADLWPYVQAAAVVHAGDVAFVLGSPRPGPRGLRHGCQGLRARSMVAREVATATLPATLTGVALEHARAMVSRRSRRSTGWPTTAGEPLPANRSVGGAFGRAAWTRSPTGPSHSTRSRRSWGRAAKRALRRRRIRTGGRSFAGPHRTPPG